MLLQFYGGTDFPGVDIDDVLLEDTGTVFLNPEESRIFKSRSLNNLHVGETRLIQKFHFPVVGKA